MKSYRDLEIYKLAFDLAFEVHQMSLTLPKHELYEQGSQIRRSSKSVKDNIVEGYGRRRYKAELIKYLTYAQASHDETSSQLQMINRIYSSNPTRDRLVSNYQILGRKINQYLQYVENNWRT